MKDRKIKRFTVYRIIAYVLAIVITVVIYSSFSVPYDMKNLTLFILFPAFLICISLLFAHLEKQAVEEARSSERIAQQNAESVRWAATQQRLETEPLIRSAKKLPKSSLNPSFDTWCRTAVSYIPRFRRGTVYAELYSHILDHYTTLLDSRDPEAAARMALTAMGDAEETGRRLRRAEWAPGSIVRNAKLLLSGRKWVVYYRGSDVKRYATLIDQLTLAQIPYRKEELDGFTRSNLANLTPGRYAMDNTPRRDGTIPSLHAALATESLRSNFPDQYTIFVRQRDLPATHRIGLA